jgi:quercetin dioxygenase-like cupin family protein
MSFDYTAPHGGTPIPGANPDGYMLGPDDGTMTWFAGALITFRAKAADTRGVLSFFQCDVPYGWQAPVHRHANESELFHITEGEWEVYVNDTVHLVTPGCTVWIPQSTAHSIFVRSKRAAASASSPRPDSRSSSRIWESRRRCRACRRTRRPTRRSRNCWPAARRWAGSSWNRSHAGCPPDGRT